MAAGPVEFTAQNLTPATLLVDQQLKTSTQMTVPLCSVSAVLLLELPLAPGRASEAREFGSSYLNWLSSIYVPPIRRGGRGR